MPVCRICGKQFPNRVLIDGEMKNINKRKYCLDCSPFGEHNTRVIERSYHCTRCGETNPDMFPKGRYTECKACRNKYNLDKKLPKKLKAIEYFGGKCKVCGYNKYPCSLDFHHLDGDEKDDNFSTHLYWSWDRLQKELDKCVLLCSNCHRAVHSGYITLD